ncbi:sensor histidine kinase [Collinsella aerofaciens]|uniref:sensor histidine kinase n=1 Tax=Collinsella aerofaciens TaxID=74426 RepID=UPI00319EAD71
MVLAPQGKRTLSHRVFATIFLCAMAVIVAFTVLGAFFVQNTLADATSANLSQETELIAAALNEQQEPIAFLRSLDREDLRITLINKDGSVAYDNEASPSMLPNHGDRPEVVKAFESGSGSAERASSTLDEIMLYRAVRLNNGQVVRLAQAQPGVAAILMSLVAPMLLIAAAGAVLSFFLARRESRAIIEPLQEVDLDHPRRSYEHAYAEMVPMLERIESQRQELKRQMAVLADNDRMRREFTANITHELKTPLTAISGYAELIANGMVEGEGDLRTFGGRIYREAGRLAALVNDILTLSNLDEAERASDGEAVPIGSTEPIELSRAMLTVEHRLEQVARQSNVTIGHETKPVVIEGVSRLIDELIYNLASNAIRYNRPGGTVTLRCGTNDEGHPYLSVADTGIGIAPEEQGKVFERFYRVDKSRSKARGGTGLGLAIVKHAALYHHAAIDLSSEPGVGTTISVTFPVQQEGPFA